MRALVASDSDLREKRTTDRVASDSDMRDKRMVERLDDVVKGMSESLQWEIDKLESKDAKSVGDV